MLGDANGLVVLDALASSNPSEHVLLSREAIGGNNRRDGPTDHLRRGVAEHLLGATIPRLHDAVEILADDRVVGGVDDRRQPARLPLHEAPLGDVTGDLRGAHDHTG